MSDPWVTSTQNWLNANYTHVSEWEPVAVTGKTGWPTMYALTRALQHELGLTSLSDSFGPGTLAALTALGNVSQSTTNKNIVRILQGALYCKGYDGGGGQLSGDYTTAATGVSEILGDMGLTASGSSVSPKVFKALLTMDAYVLLSGGSIQVRDIQRDLNRRYLHRQDFFVIPADGNYSRDVQRGLMLALQYEIGMADGVANGNFGPGTQAGVSAQANFGPGNSDASTGKYFIHLYQAALLFNNFPTPYDGVFTAALQASTTAFQEFCLLAQSGRSDFRTWASLLVSTGDATRPGKAADTIRQITSDRASTLVANGYETVGRYLTNRPIPGSLDKNIKPGELTDIFAAGLTVFPIFQEGGADLDFFDYSQGYVAGQRAHDSAHSYGFKPATVIYFAVDFDAMEDEVRSSVVPYFQGVRDGLASKFSRYRVGIYGSRNTCSIVSNAGLAELSFVSGMSTGFSGNLGYPLPSNWAFDQVLEYEIGAGTGWVNIDKDIKSGRDLGQGSVLANPTAPNQSEAEKAISYMYRVQALARAYRDTHPSAPGAADLTARYLRKKHYSGLDWALLGGPYEPDFTALVETSIPPAEVPLAFKNLPSTPVAGVDWPHMLATNSAYVYRGPSSSQIGPQFSDIGGWAGDQATMAVDWYINGKGIPGSTPYSYCMQIMNGAVSGSFGPSDVTGDVFGWLAAHSLSTGRASNLAQAITLAVDHSTYPGENSFDSFIRLRWGSIANGFFICKQVFDQPGDTGDRIAFNGSRTYLLQNYSEREPLYLSQFTSDQLHGIAKAVVNTFAGLSTHYSPLP
ncbi:glycoside hydrolase domain-containing protein [Leucobacter iarius]|uniref:Rv2525c-like glycoside hydrolase-like domain-containing protein n=1 Tax=Leucobacter iarius TaxID=333963 RepID=A0ABN2L7B2_9MICO